MQRALGYVRQSRKVDADDSFSRASQIADIRTLAARDGLTVSDADIIEDLGRSGGRKQTALRDGYTRLLDEMATGSVSVVYAKNLSRLGRSISELIKVADLAQDMGIKLVLMQSGPIDPTEATGKMMLHQLATFAEFERDLAKERARDNAAVNRATGKRMGSLPYGERVPTKRHPEPFDDDPQAVIDAFQQHGSLAAAARALNAAGLPPYRGDLWNAISVRNVVRRLAPELLPARPARGVRPKSPYRFFHLLTCGSCGDRLRAHRNPGGTVCYRCHRARIDSRHPKGRYIAESTLVQLVASEVEHFAPDVVSAESVDEAIRKAYERRDRVMDALESGLTTKADATKRLARIDDEVTDLIAMETWSKAVPNLIDWTDGDPVVVNRFLTEVFVGITVNPDYRSLTFGWRHPEWRAPDGRVAEWDGRIRVA